MGKEIRFFLAHRKACTAAEVEELEMRATALLVGVSKGKPFTVKTGRDYFEERFKACGSWEAWAAEVAQGRGYPDRQPIFNAIIVPDQYVGSATAKIVSAAIAVGKPVYIMDAVAFRPVVRVQCEDRKDFKAGYRIVERS